MAYTVFGRFTEHHLTPDLTPLRGSRTDISTLVNSRTRGTSISTRCTRGGPANSPALYIGSRFRLAPDGRDVPPRPDGTAIIADARNDENAIISQLHMVFLRLHNSFVDKGLSFAEAHHQLLARYQKVAVKTLAGMAGPTVTNQALMDLMPLYKPNENVDLPVEITVAAYRFGHSMVRTAYRLAEEEEGVDVPFTQVFDGTPNDLTGGLPVPPDMAAYWPNFLQFPDEPAPVKSIDPRPDLDRRPVRASVPVGEQRWPIELGGAESDQGQEVWLGIGTEGCPSPWSEPSTNRQLGISATFGGGAPLWFYVLGEANSRTGGGSLGKVGGMIVAATFVGLLKDDPNSHPHAEHGQGDSRRLHDRSVDRGGWSGRLQQR